MKNLNLKTTKTLIYIIAILLLFGACKPEPIESNPTITYHRLKTEQLNKTPYFTNPDFDTLTYLSNKGDTLIFAKLKTDTTWYYIRTQGAPGVTLNEDYYQTLRNTYQTIKGNGKFEVRHVLNGSSSIVSNARDFIEINFNNSIHFFYDYWIGSKTYPTYIESLTVNNKTYNHAFIKYLNIDFDNPDTVNTSFIIINQDYGVFYKRVKNPLIEFYLIK